MMATNKRLRGNQSLGDGMKQAHIAKRSFFINQSECWLIFDKFNEMLIRFGYYSQFYTF